MTSTTAVPTGAGVPAPTRIPGRIPERSRTARRRRETVTVILAIFAGLQIMAAFTPEYLIPSPASMLRSAAEILTREPMSLLVTLGRLLLGVLASLVLGSALGAVMGMVPAVGRYSETVMFVLSGVPALSWMLLAVLWFPQTELRIFVVLFIVLVPFYALNVHEGLRALPKEWVEMLEVFCPTRLQTLRLLILPQLAPYVILTTKSVSGYAIRMVIFAELIGAATGAGARLAQAQGMLRVDRIFAWTILLVVLNFLIQQLVSVADRRMLGWRPAVEIR